MSAGRHADGGRTRLSIDQAVAALVAAVEPTAVETIAVDDACGRVTAEPVAARASVPDVHLSAMDGIAVRAADLAGASDASPVELDAGRRPGDGGFAWIDTGQPMPAGFDAVVMVERVEPVSGAGAKPDTDRARVVRVRQAPSPWTNVRVVGEDVVAGERLVPAGHRLSAADLGLLLAAGVDRVAVRRPPTVAILPTGDELVEPGAARPPGTTIESNSRVLAAMLSARGALALRLPRVGDDPDALVRAVADAAARADVVCTIAGSSAGSRDWTATAFAAVGRVFATGIGLVPGRPTILAEFEREAGRRARVAIGLPGYPIAAAMVAREVLSPLVARLLGSPHASPAVRQAVAADAIPTRSDLDELVRVDVVRIDDRTVVHPLARGAGALSSLSRAGGLVRLRPGQPAIEPGSVVEVEDVDGEATPFTLLLAGLADPAVDALEDALRARGLAVRIALRPCGDEAAARMLEAGLVHGCVRVRPSGADGSRPAAGSSSGEPGSGDGADGGALRRGDGSSDTRARARQEVVLARRASGLVVARGNPLGIAGLADATRSGVRALPLLKRGGVLAGARPLSTLAPALGPRADGVDGALAGAAEIPPLAAAALVAAGVADVAVGTAEAAALAGADFVPLRDDEVVLELPEEPGWAPILRAIREGGFRA